MAIKILMPALSPTMTEGNLAKWCKKEGDTVESGDVIAEIETDKATMEVEAVDEGVIGKIIVAEGTAGVAVNEVIAILLEEGEDETALEAVSTDAPTPAAAEKEAPEQEEAPKADASEEKSQPTVKAEKKSSTGRIFSSPLARRLAGMYDLDLSQITGTGPNGRIVKADVEAAKGAKATASTQAPKSAPTAMPQGVDAKAQADLLGIAYREEKASSIRKTIANRLTEAKQTVPHFYLTVDCEIDALLEGRKRLNAAQEKMKTGVKMSVNDFVIKAVAAAMREIPEVNASWAGDSIIHYENVDISVAVATPNGLITPILKNADEKGLATLSSEMKDLASRARDGKLRPEEYQGGGFSISNLGMFGIKDFSAIINPPQSCILAVGAGEQRAVVKNGQLAVATVMTCTLSVDHRVVDGAVGAQFLAAFKRYIEDPLALIV